MINEILEMNNLPFEMTGQDDDGCVLHWTGGEADMEITLHGDCLEELAGDAYEQWREFDSDYETALWIGEDGHGKNGAPYHIKDILADFEKYEKDLEELALVLYRQDKTL